MFRRVVAISAVATFTLAALFGCAGVLGVEELRFETSDARADVDLGDVVSGDDATTEASTDANADASFCEGWDFCDDFDQNPFFLQRWKNGTSPEGGTVTESNIALSPPRAILATTAQTPDSGECYSAKLTRDVSGATKRLELEVALQLGADAGLSTSGNVLGWSTRSPDGGGVCDGWLDVDESGSVIFEQTPQAPASPTNRPFTGFPTPNAWTRVRLVVEGVDGGMRVTVAYPEIEAGTVQDFAECGFGGAAAVHVGLRCHHAPRAMRFDDARIRAE